MTTVDFDPFELLDLPREATTEEIKRAARAKRAAWHSDRLGPNATPEQQDHCDEMVKRVSEAEALLTDPIRRREYQARSEPDPWGTHGDAPPGPPPDAPGSDGWGEPAVAEPPPPPDHDPFARVDHDEDWDSPSPSWGFPPPPQDPSAPFAPPVEPAPASDGIQPPPPPSPLSYRQYGGVPPARARRRGHPRVRWILVLVALIMALVMALVWALGSWVNLRDTPVSLTDPVGRLADPAFSPAPSSQGGEVFDAGGAPAPGAIRIASTTMPGEDGNSPYGRFRLHVTVTSTGQGQAVLEESCVRVTGSAEQPSPVVATSGLMPLLPVTEASTGPDGGTLTFMAVVPGDYEFLYGCRPNLYAPVALGRVETPLVAFWLDPDPAAQAFGHANAFVAVHAQVKSDDGDYLYRTESRLRLDGQQPDDDRSLLACRVPTRERTRYHEFRTSAGSFVAEIVQYSPANGFPLIQCFKDMGAQPIVFK